MGIEWLFFVGWLGFGVMVCISAALLLKLWNVKDDLRRMQQARDHFREQYQIYQRHIFGNSRRDGDED